MRPSIISRHCDSVEAFGALSHAHKSCPSPRSVCTPFCHQYLQLCSFAMRSDYASQNSEGHSPLTRLFMESPPVAVKEHPAQSQPEPWKEGKLGRPLVALMLSRRGHCTSTNFACSGFAEASATASPTDHAASQHRRSLVGEYSPSGDGHASPQEPHSENNGTGTLLPDCRRSDEAPQFAKSREALAASEYTERAQCALTDRDHSVNRDPLPGDVRQSSWASLAANAGLDRALQSSVWGWPQSIPRSPTMAKP